MTLRKSLFTVSGLVALALGSAQAAPLTVTVTDVEARGGTLYVGVQTEDQFLKDAGIGGAMKAEPEAGTHTFTIDLAEGQYAVSVWHDLDSDYVFDMDANGMPAEGWSMIGGAEMKGPPEWAKQSLSLGASGAAVSLATVYPK